MAKKKLLFKKGINTIHIPLGYLPIPMPNGDVIVNPTREMERFKAKYTWTKKARLTFHVDFERRMAEIRLSK